jgi:hypothetical protein
MAAFEIWKILLVSDRYRLRMFSPRSQHENVRNSHTSDAPFLQSMQRNGRLQSRSRHVLSIGRRIKMKQLLPGSHAAKPRCETPCEIVARENQTWRYRGFTVPHAVHRLPVLAQIRSLSRPRHGCGLKGSTSTQSCRTTRCQQRPITSLLNKKFQPPGINIPFFMPHRNTQRFRNGRWHSVVLFSLPRKPCASFLWCRPFVVASCRALLASSTFSNARKIICTYCPSRQRDDPLAAVIRGRLRLC